MTAMTMRRSVIDLGADFAAVPVGIGETNVAAAEPGDDLAFSDGHQGRHTPRDRGDECDHQCMVEPDAPTRLVARTFALSADGGGDQHQGRPQRHTGQLGDVSASARLRLPTRCTVHDTATPTEIRDGDGGCKPTPRIPQVG